MKSPLEALREKNPWPDDCPRYSPFYWSLDAGGKEIVKDIIRDKRVGLILEVGVFFGGSCRQWLEAGPDLTVIGMDPWVGDFSDYLVKNRKSYPHLDIEALAAQLRAPDAMYQSALSNLWAYRDRFIPVRGGAPEKLHELHRLGVKPDLIYLDTDKHGKHLDVYPDLFPEAILTGDDWTWGKARGYPRKRSIKAFADRRGYAITVSEATWVLHKK